MLLYPDIEFINKINAYLDRYGRDQWDVVERGFIGGYDVEDCWDLAYDALQQDKKLEFFWSDEAMTDLRFRYVVI
jgi:hypothetical protein